LGPGISVRISIVFMVLGSFSKIQSVSLHHQCHSSGGGCPRNLLLFTLF
jgi:hypothetical protein